MYDAGVYGRKIERGKKFSDSDVTGLQNTHNVNKNTYCRREYSYMGIRIWTNKVF